MSYLLLFPEWYYFLQQLFQTIRNNHCYFRSLRDASHQTLLQLLKYLFHYRFQLNLLMPGYVLHEWNYIPFPEEFPPGALWHGDWQLLPTLPGHGAYKHLLISHFCHSAGNLFLYQNSNSGSHILYRRYLKACPPLLLPCELCKVWDFLQTKVPDFLLVQLRKFQFFRLPVLPLPLL